MVLWGHGRMERWRCPACHRIRRKDYHAKVEIEEGAPRQEATGAVYLEDPDVTLYNGDCLDVLRKLPDDSVDCVVTSPPYWGLRDYKAEGQLGMEETPGQFVTKMTDVFQEVKRVLAPYGTCWLNLGDTYATDVQGFKAKDLIGIPWRVAFALQDTGWWLRSDIIWAKANPMPESVVDRPTRSHEYIFMLSKAARYWWDVEAVREPHKPDGRKVTQVQTGVGLTQGSIQHRDGERWPNSGRNIRTVWEIAAQPYPGAHFATFPEDLARRAILAGCPIKVCQECGVPSERIVKRELADVEGWAPVRKLDHSQGAAEQGNGRFGDPVVQTLGWTDCGHNAWRPGVVLDPFMGSGTVAKVARNHQRHAVGIELNPEYCALAADRLAQQSLFTEAY
jgi:DNA modification methylase